jgi:glycosyltransferase involved in cell wall biosynthesis
VQLVVPEGYDDPRRPSGGNVYDRRLCEGMRQLGRAMRVCPVPGPWLGGTGRLEADVLAELLAATPDAAVVLIDGLVGSGLPEVLLPEAGRLRLVALVHLPLGVGEGSAAADVGHSGGPGEPVVGDLPLVRLREQAVLGGCAAVVVTSHWTRRWLLQHYALSADAVLVAEPGVDRAPVAEAGPSGGRLLAVGAVTPVKGHDLLVAALGALSDLDWTCTIVGSTAVEPAYAAQVARDARSLGIDERVRFRGPLSDVELDAAYAAADVLVLPSRAETYGMVVTEALARGLPVIAADVGGVADTLRGSAARPGDAGSDGPAHGRRLKGAAGPGTGGGRSADSASRDLDAEGGGSALDPAGVLVEPDDGDALAVALSDWLDDGAWRDELRTSTY